jgi:hypothetical protein
MRRALPFGVVLGLAAAAQASAATKPPDLVAQLRRDVEFLSSPALEGRLAGSSGERRAARYLVAELLALGAQPLPGRVGLELPFEFTAGTRDAGSWLRLGAQPAAVQRTWRGSERVRALSFSDNGTVSGPVVFAGYGLSIPDGQDTGYDSYAGLDVKDKLVLVLRYFPEDVEGDQRAALARYSGLRYKAMLARERGARALIVATGPRSPNAGTTVEMTFDAAISGSGIVAASVAGEVAEALFRAAGRDLAETQAALDSGNPHAAAGFLLGGIEVTLETAVERERRVARNVVGVLPAEPAPEGGTTSAPSGSGRDHLMLGAHFDHLGRGRHGNSLAREDEADRIHPGADDNASGVAAVLAVAARLAREPRRMPIVVALWSGEELGLLGSSDFVDRELLPPARIAAYLNFDMVGRMENGGLTLQAVASSPVWPKLIEQTNVVAGLDVHTQSEPYLPTDSATLYRAGVPTLNFFTGSHEDYHRPTDRAETIRYDGLVRVVEFATLMTRKLDGLAEAPEWTAVAVSPERTGQRDSLRAYTGTVPDYATEVAGLRLSAVSAGGPADLAGLRAGDVIVEFAGREITNIYDYTYALDAVKIGEPTTVVVLRGGERLALTVTPTARP